MTIVIIQRGSVPSERSYQTQCRQCKTVFAFTEGDARRVFDQRDGDYLTLPCPACQSHVTKAVK